MITTIMSPELYFDNLGPGEVELVEREARRIDRSCVSGAVCVVNAYNQGVMGYKTLAFGLNTQLPLPERFAIEIAHETC